MNLLRWVHFFYPRYPIPICSHRILPNSTCKGVIYFCHARNTGTSFCINNLLFFCFSLTCKVPLQSTVSVTHKIVNLSVTVIIAFFHISSRLRLFFAPPIHSQFWEAMGHRASLRPERAFPGISTSHNHATFISTIHMILMIQLG